MLLILMALLFLLSACLQGGSKVTVKYAGKHKKLCLCIDLNIGSIDQMVEKLSQWIKQNQIEALNVAGSRESKHPGICKKVYEIVKKVVEG